MKSNSYSADNPTQVSEAPYGDEYGPALMGPFAPVFDESTWDNLEVIGEIPTDLSGVYLRNGPNPRFAPQGRYHPFDGDGMLHAAHFKNGTVTYRNKWVQTDDFKREHEAEQPVFWGIRETLKGRDDKELKDSSNTDVVGHAGVALASWYMSGDIYKIDPITLKTLGKADYAAGLGAGFSAHAKVDQRNGDLMFFDYWNEAPYMSYGVVDKNGKVVNHVPIDLPGPRLPHDMAITENYSILHDLPLYHNEEAMSNGRHKLEFHPDKTTRFGVIPRYGKSEDVKWFDFTPCFLYHTVNAWEEGDEIVMVACRYMPFLKENGDIDAIKTAKKIAMLGMNARLWRYRMNLVTGEGHEEPVNTEFNVEFPSLHPGMFGIKTQWAYLVDHHPEILHWTGLRKFNTDTGECVGAFTDGHDHTWYSEPWFAPADNATQEDHGYVVVFAWNDKDKEQQLQVFDAQDISAGPVARIKLPRRVPVGFHGCWMQESTIQSASA